MIQSAGIEFNDLPEEAADELLGEYTGAETIFGVTGGVMEAALRTAYCLITGEAQPPSIDFQMVRGQGDTIWSAPGRKTKHFPGGPESVPAESKGVARSHKGAWFPHGRDRARPSRFRQMGLPWVRGMQGEISA